MEFIYEHASSLNLKETLDKVKSTLKENGFGTLFELNFKDKFKEHDIEFAHNFYVLEVCNPKLAKQVLDISMDIGYFLPCKVVVYEKSEGVFVGMMKPTSMIHMVSENIEAMEVARKVEEIISDSLRTVKE